MKVKFLLFNAIFFALLAVLLLSLKSKDTGYTKNGSVVKDKTEFMHISSAGIPFENKQNK